MAKKNLAPVSLSTAEKPTKKAASVPLTPHLPKRGHPLEIDPKSVCYAFQAESGEGPVNTLVRVLDENGLRNLTAKGVADGTVDRFSDDPEYGRFTLARGVDGRVIAAGWEGKYLGADVAVLSADLGRRVDVTVSGKTSAYYKSTGNPEGDLALVNAGGHVCSWEHLGGSVAEDIRYKLLGPAYACIKAFVDNLEDIGFTGDVMSAEECHYKRSNSSSLRLLAPLEGYSSFAHADLSDLNINVSLCIRNDVLHVTAYASRYYGRQWYIRSYQLDTDDPALTFTIERQQELLTHFGHSIQFG